MNTSNKTLQSTHRRLPPWASAGLATLVIGMLGAFALAPDASAQGYRYGIESNGFNRGGSAVIGQQGVYSANRPTVSTSNANRGSVTNYYYNTPRRYGFRRGYGGYGYGGYGYGYRSYGYGFVP
ncbi:hypothetical protein, partial [Rhodopirellula sp. UBA1907]